MYLFQSRPGFIAGVVNPIFEFNTSEWDVLLNIDNGKVLISKDIQHPPPASSGVSLQGSITSTSVNYHAKDLSLSDEGDVLPSTHPSKKSLNTGGIVDSQDMVFLEEASANAKGIDQEFSRAEAMLTDPIEISHRSSLLGATYPFSLDRVSHAVDPYRCEIRRGSLWNYRHWVSQ
jgi:hypothetical protein